MKKPTLIKQICPICKRYVKYSSRYPTYICQRCITFATDKKGKGVIFYNPEFSGHGCAGKYRHIRNIYPYRICYIRGIECKVNEAYFGGIVLLTSTKNH